MAREQFTGYEDAWRYERFISAIEQNAGITWVEAERDARAALETLAERISRTEILELSSELPPQLQKWLLDAGGARPERFGPDEFVRRVATRAGDDEETAEAHTKAVFVGLARLVRHQEMRTLAHQLPSSYRTLIGEALHRPRDPSAPQALPIKEFMRRVEDRIGTADAETAVRATEAVLETLAERIAAGQVEDMLAALPEELHPPLERGVEHSRHAVRMSLDEFVWRVAEREAEGVTYEEALEHARAVFRTLRDALPDKEFSDLLSELPRGYYEALL
jgi:uncharacterized protein (DUF2267 family)